MSIKIKDIQKVRTRSVSISIRTYKEYSEFMKTKGISPSKLFNSALEQLMDESKK